MLAIIHGWSDTSESFERLADRLVQEVADLEVQHVVLGDYVSMDDRVTLDDLAEALGRAWVDPRNNLPQTARSTDIIVHSTGALVVRAWMTKYYEPRTNPVRRFVMLGAANFGSHLAHKGRSFAGRVMKGLNKKHADKIRNGPRLHTGTKILEGLELASSYTRELAEKDCFASEKWYGQGRVLCTSIVGSSGYTNIAAAANEPGSDGTVRVSTANLNPTRILLNFADNPKDPGFEHEPANGLTAFARINHENHSTIALKHGGPRESFTIETIKSALRVDDRTFEGFAKELEFLNSQSRKDGLDDPQTNPYQNTIVRVIDHHDQPVNDYFLELFAKKRPEADPTSGKTLHPAKTPDVHHELTRYLQEKVLGKVHTNRLDPSSRSFMINTHRLFSKFGEHVNRSLYISITAMPNIDETGSVGYRTLEYNDIGSICVEPRMLPTLFAPDRTALFTIRIRREQHPYLFDFKPLPR